MIREVCDTMLTDNYIIRTNGWFNLYDKNNTLVNCNTFVITVPSNFNKNSIYLTMDMELFTGSNIGSQSGTSKYTVVFHRDIQNCNVKCTSNTMLNIENCGHYIDPKPIKEDGNNLVLTFDILLISNTSYLTGSYKLNIKLHHNKMVDFKPQVTCRESYIDINPNWYPLDSGDIVDYHDDINKTLVQPCMNLYSNEVTIYGGEPTLNLKNKIISIPRKFAWIYILQKTRQSNIISSSTSIPMNNITSIGSLITSSPWMINIKNITDGSFFPLIEFCHNLSKPININKELDEFSVHNVSFTNVSDVFIETHLHFHSINRTELNLTLRTGTGTEDNGFIIKGFYRKKSFKIFIKNNKKSYKNNIISLKKYKKLPLLLCA